RSAEANDGADPSPRLPRAHGGRDRAFEPADHLIGCRTKMDGKRAGASFGQRAASRPQHPKKQYERPEAMSMRLVGSSPVVEKRKSADHAASVSRRDPSPSANEPSIAVKKFSYLRISRAEKSWLHFKLARIFSSRRGVRMRDKSSLGMANARKEFSPAPNE